MGTMMITMMVMMMMMMVMIMTTTRTTMMKNMATTVMRSMTMRIRRMIRTCRKSTGFKIRQIQDQNTDALSIHTGLVLRVRYDNIFGWLEGRMISGDNLVTSGHAGIKLYPEFSHNFFVNKIR